MILSKVSILILILTYVDSIHGLHIINNKKNSISKSFSYTDYNEIDVKKQIFDVNVGKTLTTLQRDLPMLFNKSDLDFSIFANNIIVIYENKNKFVMTKSLYCASVKSVQISSSFSSINPSIDVKKIEYIKDYKTIKCLVDILLPHSLISGDNPIWQGNFYFGIDDEGLIDSHIFDKTITTLQPFPSSNVPWLINNNNNQWCPDLFK